MDRYEEALERAKAEWNADITEGTRNVLLTIFPQFKESEDERIRKAIISGMTALKEQGKETFATININDCIVWLEKQSEPLDKEKVLIGARKDVALSIMDFLDRNTLGMCLSNMECEDLEDAVVNSNWSKVYDYMKKKLEKQGEQKSSNKVEPKFKVGAWVVFNNKHQSIYQVEKIEDGYYILRHTHGGTFRVCVLHDESLRLWTIQDAKDGDVIFYDDGWTCILKHIHGIWYSSYCFITADGEFHMGYEQHAVDSTINGNAHPATKEQRDTLMKAMADARYTFDFGKKELKKIEQKSSNKVEPKFPCHSN